MKNAVIAIHQEENRKNIYFITWFIVDAENKMFDLTNFGELSFKEELNKQCPIFNNNILQQSKFYSLPEIEALLIKTLVNKYKIFGLNYLKTFFPNLPISYIDHYLYETECNKYGFSLSNNSYYQAANLGRLLIKKSIA